jgi:hypothetical protein
MKVSRIILAVTLAAMLSTPVFAQGQAPAQGQGGGGAGTGNSVKMDVAPFINSVDTNKDGNISLEEWKAAGLNENIFSIFDSKKQNSFAKDVMANMTHPSDIDANKDGKMTLEEFKNYTKNLGSQGGAPGGAAPSGAAPGGAPNK